MMRLSIIALVLTLFCLEGYAQEMGYDIFATYSIPVLEEKLNGANAMSDINPDYPSSWINDSDYVSSEINVISDGKALIAVGKNDVFTEEQKSLLQKADLGTTIDIEVKYSAKNSITGNLDIKIMNFSVSLIPENEAVYPGGQDEMKAYLKLNAVDKIMASDHNTFEMAKVSFIVDEEGKTTMAKIVSTSDDEEIDQLLLQTISNMPNWNPAQSANGVKMKQEFEFVVGTMMGC